MEGKIQFGNRQRLQKTLIFLVFGLFTARAQAQLLDPPPSITVPPVGISVQNGGTAILTASAASLPLPITSVTWYRNGKAVSSGVLTVNLGATAVTTLTVSNVSSADNGNVYDVKVSNAMGSTTSSNATLVVVLNTVNNVLTAVTGASKMLTAGFKVQFSAPTGSNIVIQATSDMSHWSSIYTNVASGGSVTCTDAVAKTCSCRFYRARIK